MDVSRVSTSDDLLALSDDVVLAYRVARCPHDGDEWHHGCPICSKLKIDRNP